MSMGAYHALPAEPVALGKKLPATSVFTYCSPLGMYR